MSHLCSTDSMTAVDVSGREQVWHTQGHQLDPQCPKKASDYNKYLPHYCQDEIGQ